MTRFDLVAFDCDGVLVDSEPIGVAAGVAAGMTVFGYAERIDARVLLAAGASAVFADMALLPDLLQ